MSDTVEVHGLKVDRELVSFMNEEGLPGTGIAPDRFWSEFSAIATDLAPKNRSLLEKREALQAEIDRFHLDHRDGGFDATTYRKFLTDIGYLIPEGEAFSVATANVDPEIANIAGPQLVVPIMNARFALNAANARWGSLYDALYGTDAMGNLPRAAMMRSAVHG